MLNNLIFNKSKSKTGTINIKRGMAEMLKSGVIMDVVTPEQAKIAEDAGAVAVMALEQVPADICTQNGVSRMSNLDIIEKIINLVTIPVMAKIRIGHFVEAQILQELGVDYIDESEVLTSADCSNYVNKHKFTSPFVCGATSLSEAICRITEGAAMIRSKGKAGTGNISHAITHIRKIKNEIKYFSSISKGELHIAIQKLQLNSPFDIELLLKIRANNKLPVTLFSAGGIATPADAAMMMQLGAEGVFVGSGIFKSENPIQLAKSIVKATYFYNDPVMLAKISKGIGKAMSGINFKSNYFINNII